MKNNKVEEPRKASENKQYSVGRLEYPASTVTTTVNIGPGDPGQEEDGMYTKHFYRTINAVVHLEHVTSRVVIFPVEPKRQKISRKTGNVSENRFRVSVKGMR